MLLCDVSENFLRYEARAVKTSVPEVLVGCAIQECVPSKNIIALIDGAREYGPYE